MVLPTSGQISFSQINIEIGRNSTASLSLRTAETNGYGAVYCIRKCTTPYPTGSDTSAAISEWYGYDHSAAATLISTYDETQFATEAALCADTSPFFRVPWYKYEPNGKYYVNDTLGRCCGTCIADGYYRNGTDPSRWILISSCLGTTGSCAGPPPPPICYQGDPIPYNAVYANSTLGKNSACGDEVTPDGSNNLFISQSSDKAYTTDNCTVLAVAGYYSIGQPNDTVIFVNTSNLYSYVSCV